MNRGFTFYFKEAFQASARTILKKKRHISYYIYSFMELIARTLILPGLLFDLSAWRQAKYVREEQEVEIARAFESASNPRAVWTMFLTALLGLLMLLGGVVLIGIFGGVLWLVGTLVASFVSGADAQMIPLYFTIPAMLVLAVYAVVLLLVLAPSAYIIDCNPNVTAAQVISACFAAMKSEGKLTLLLNTLFPTLMHLLILGVGAGVSYLFGEIIKDVQVLNAVTLVWGIAVLAVYLWFSPVFRLTVRVANRSLFDDIVYEGVNAPRRVNGVAIKAYRGKEFEISSEESNLARLFDETQEEHTAPQQTEQAAAQERGNRLLTVEHDKKKKPKAGKRLEELGEELKPDLSQLLGEQSAEPSAEAEEFSRQMAAAFETFAQDEPQTEFSEEQQTEPQPLEEEPVPTVSQLLEDQPIEESAAEEEEPIPTVTQLLENQPEEEGAAEEEEPIPTVSQLLEDQPVEEGAAEEQDANFAVNDLSEESLAEESPISAEQVLTEPEEPTEGTEEEKPKKKAVKKTGKKEDGAEKKATKATKKRTEKKS